jgi:hypothetical protein
LLSDPAQDIHSETSQCAPIADLPGASPKPDNTFSDGRSQGRRLHTPEPFDNLEERMNVTAFSSPVFVKHGSYLVQEIVDLADAIEFLEDLPEDRRSLTEC